MTPLARRAKAAVALTRQVTGERDRPPVDAHARRVQAELVRGLTTALGVDPADVVTVDDPRRPLGGYVGHILVVVDEGADGGWRAFVPEVGNDGVYLLLGPCPECRRDVPVASIADLYDLGRHLDDEELADGDTATRRRPLEFFGDPLHVPGCQFAAPGPAPADPT